GKSTQDRVKETLLGPTRELTASGKAVTPLPVLRSSRATEGGKNGVQGSFNCFKLLDSRLRGNDRKEHFWTFTNPSKD
ncbi:MAG: hypothetical protein ABIG67_02200, partial [Pseudomonadota bacterium]